MSVSMLEVSNVTNQFHRLKGQQEALSKSKDLFDTELEACAEQLSVCRDAKTLLELFVRSTETSIKDFLEPIVTESLEIVFEQYLKFHVVFFQRRNQVEVDFIILRSQDQEEEFQKLINEDTESKRYEELIKESKNINFMYGGAINQVLGLVLRMILFHTLKIHGPLVLDEPSSAVSPNYNTQLGRLIASLSSRLEVQIVLITHSPELASYAEKTYLVSKVGGVSQVEEDVSSNS